VVPAGHGLVSAPEGGPAQEELFVGPGALVSGDVDQAQGLGQGQADASDSGTVVINARNYLIQMIDKILRKAGTKQTHRTIHVVEAIRGQLEEIRPGVALSRLMAWHEQCAHAYFEQCANRRSMRI
jgi:hypothetical protein